MGINVLRKEYKGEHIFSGAWSENLNKGLKVYDILESMCQITGEEKLKGMHVMLTGHAFYFYAESSIECVTYEVSQRPL